MKEKTVYLLQRVNVREVTMWPDGRPPTVERQAHYETLFETEVRSEAISVCKYEIKRSGKPCRIITKFAWSQQTGADQIPVIAPTKRVRVQTAHRQPISIGSSVSRGRSRQKQQGSINSNHYQKRTDNLWALLKAIW